MQGNKLLLCSNCQAAEYCSSHNNVYGRPEKRRRFPKIVAKMRLELRSFEIVGQAFSSCPTLILLAVLKLDIPCLTIFMLIDMAIVQMMLLTNILLTAISKMVQLFCKPIKCREREVSWDLNLNGTQEQFHPL